MKKLFSWIGNTIPDPLAVCLLWVLWGVVILLFNVIDGKPSNSCENRLLTGKGIAAEPFDPNGTTNWIVVTNHFLTSSFFEVVVSDGRNLFAGISGSIIPEGSRVQFKSVSTGEPWRVIVIAPIE